MYLDLACGPCGSSLSLDTADEGGLETFSFDLIHRFTKAHEACGFIVPTATNSTEVQPFNKEDTP